MSNKVMAGSSDSLPPRTYGSMAMSLAVAAVAQPAHAQLLATTMTINARTCDVTGQLKSPTTNMWHKGPWRRPHAAAAMLLLVALLAIHATEGELNIWQTAWTAAAYVCLLEECCRNANFPCCEQTYTVAASPSSSAAAGAACFRNGPSPIHGRILFTMPT
jgi:hypothetical protein